MFRKLVEKFLVGLLFAVLVVLGVWHLPPPPNWARLTNMGDLTAQYWIGTVALIAAAALAVWWLTSTYFRSKYEKTLRSELHRQSEGENFRTTMGGQALNYILNDSVWGWRTYAQLNTWSFVADHVVDEFHRIAKDSQLRMKGVAKGHQAEEVINRGHWKVAEAWLSEDEGLCSEYFDLDIGSILSSNLNKKYKHISVSTDDLLYQWPRASLWHRARTTTYVYVKMKILNASDIIGYRARKTWRAVNTSPWKKPVK